MVVGKKLIQQINIKAYATQLERINISYPEDNISNNWDISREVRICIGKFAIRTEKAKLKRFL